MYPENDDVSIFNFKFKLVDFCYMTFQRCLYIKNS